MNHETNAIYEAYQQVVNEAAEAKFKVGDQVGIGSHYGHDYHAVDTGTVTKVNKFGHHTVEYHNRKSHDNAFKPKTDIFNAKGVIQQVTQRGSFDGDNKLSAISDHNDMAKGVADKQERSRDMHKIQAHLDAHKLGTGHYTKLSKSAAQQMKELIDKHTGDEA